MTKRELEDAAWKLGLYAFRVDYNGKPEWKMVKTKDDFKRKGYKNLAQCRNMREIEMFLIGVKVGKEMG